MYAILGVTGNTGAVVADALLTRGAPVRAVVRDEAKAERLRARGAEVAVADATDRTALTTAFRGARGVYALLPPDLGTDDFFGSRRTMLEAIAGAIEDAGVEHVVLLSSIGAQHAAGTGVIRALNEAEVRLRETGARLTFVRAAYFIENWGAVLGAVTSDGVLPNMLLPADRAIPMVATADIGAIAAHALLEPPSGERVIELSGPALYSPNEVAATLSKLLGKPIQVVDVPPEAQRETLVSVGISADVASLFAEMNAGIASGHVDFAGGDAQRVHGARDLETTLAALLG